MPSASLAAVVFSMFTILRSISRTNLTRTLVLLCHCLSLVSSRTKQQSITLELNLRERQGEKLEDVINFPLDSFKYIFTVPLNMGTGHGEKKQDLIFDTGSSLTWVNCVGPNFKDPTLFNGLDSPTYKELTRTNNFCIYPGLENLCTFTKTYDDGTKTSGILSRETFNFNSVKYPFKELVFGCAFKELVFGCAIEQISPSSRRNIPGIFAMGNGKLSFARQLQSFYGNVFSYYLCGRITGGTSFLTLGDNVVSKNGAQITKFSVYDTISHYYIELVDMGINGNPIRMDKRIFARRGQNVGGCILDTGSDLGALTEVPFDAVKFALKTYFTGYSLQIAKEDSMLCYSLPNNYQYVLPTILPSMSFYLEDGAEIKKKDELCSTWQKIISSVGP